jgi:hypothetical protein
MFSAEVLDLQTLSQSKPFQGLRSFWAQIKESKSMALLVNYCGAHVPTHFLGIFNAENWNVAAVWWGIVPMYHTIILSGDQKSKILVQSFQSVPFQQ